MDDKVIRAMSRFDERGWAFPRSLPFVHRYDFRSSPAHNVHLDLHQKHRRPASGRPVTDTMNSWELETTFRET
jgi:hypothetical protein